MSDPTTPGRAPGWRHLAVGAVFWQPGPNPYPQVSVDWDGDRLERDMATSLFHAIHDDPNFEGAREFIDLNPKPAHWHNPEDVEHWLEALQMEVPSPTFHRDSVLIQADDATPQDVTVAVVRWSEDIWDDTHVFAGVDPNAVERDLAEDILQRIVGPDNDEGTDAFLDIYGSPDLDDPDAVSRWLMAASRELAYPMFTTHHARVEAAPDATKAAPVVETTAVVGAIYWDGEPDEEPELIVGRDREQVERRVATRLYQGMQEHDTPWLRRFIERHARLDEWADAADVTEWLAAVEAENPGPVFVIDPLPVDQADPTRPEAVYVASVVRPDDPVWENTQLLADTTRAGVERQVAQLLHDAMAQPPSDPSAQAFLAEHGNPQTMTDPGRVAAWLEAHGREIRDPEFTIQRATLPPVVPTPPRHPAASPTVDATLAATPSVPDGAGSREVTVGVIWWDFDGEVPPDVFVGVDRAAVERSVAERLWGEMHDSPTFDAGELFDRLGGDPTGLDAEGVSHWLDGYQRATSLPEVRVADLDMDVFTAVTSQAFTQAVIGQVGPPNFDADFHPPQPESAERATVDVNRLSAGVIVWDDENSRTPTEMEVFIDTDRDALVRKMASRLFEAASYGPVSDQVARYLDRYGNPAGLDPDGVEAWLEGLREVMPNPQFTCYPVLATATDRPLPATPTPTPAPEQATSPPSVPAEPESVREDRVMAQYGREAERVWGPLLDSGIPEMLAEAFPTMPEPADWPDLDDTTSGPMWEAAVEDWMEECLDLAVHAAHVADLLDRLDALEHFQRQVAVMLADEPLPREPEKTDYLATRPAYEGEYSDMAYRWDHDQWRVDFPKAVRQRDAKLSSLLQDSMRGAPMDRPARRTHGVEKARVDALKDLIVPGPTGQALGEAWLDPDGRRRVSRLLDGLGDRPIVVPGPTGHQYSGLAQDAHRWLRPGVYEATGLGGEGRYRLVVGTAAQAGGPGWSAAVDPHDRADIAVLDDLAQLRAQAIRNKASGQHPDQTSGVRPAATVGLGTQSARPGRADWFGQLPSRPAPGMSL